MTLVGDTTYRTLQGPFFQNGLTVRVGNVSCGFTVLNSSALMIQMPNITTLFPHANGKEGCELSIVTIAFSG